MVRGGLAALMLVVPLAAGCTGDGAGNEGDCSARIGWDGTVYRAHNELNPSAPSGDELGTADVLGCDKESVATVEVLAVSGVEAAVAITVDEGTWQGVYVAEGSSPSSWPEVLRSTGDTSDAH